MVIAIIGGGASGMAAALAAAREGQNHIYLFERQARLGRKLQATGNGRCNLSNRRLSLENFHGEDAVFAKTALEAYPPEKVLSWFSQLGLYTVTEDSGRVYPYSDQAGSVVDVLRLALERENITVITGCHVDKIRRQENGFLLQWAQESLQCHRVIVACGGLAGTKLGGGMSGYQLLRSLGHHCTRLRPSLVQLQSDWRGCVSLKGVRANCRAEILKDGAVFSQSTGELQFTDYGISGPVVFEISRDVCAKPGDWRCRLDFLPDMSREELLTQLQMRRQRQTPLEDLLTGILHNRLGRILCHAVGVRGQDSAQRLSEEALLAVCDGVKGFELTLTQPMGMDCAQVTAGGMVTQEFNPATLESKLVPGLYACGEVLDIDGDCGGYNLQWAWSSGLLCGTQAAKQ